MNDHVTNNEADFPLMWATGERQLRRPLMLPGGLSAVVAGAAMAVVGNSGSHASALESVRLSMPLGITLATFGVILLRAVVFGSVSQLKKNASALDSAGAGNRQSAIAGPAAAKRPVASELALLAELHAQGDPSAAVFDVAKLRVPGD